jgi:hypothetical protein
MYDDAMPWCLRQRSGNSTAGAASSAFSASSLALGGHLIHGGGEGFCGGGGLAPGRWRKMPLPRESCSGLKIQTSSATSACCLRCGARTHDACKLSQIKSNQIKPSQFKSRHMRRCISRSEYDAAAAEQQAAALAEPTVCEFEPFIRAAAAPRAGRRRQAGGWRPGVPARQSSGTRDGAHMRWCAHGHEHEMLTIIEQR